MTSADGGEYTCALVGVALPPRPQGPIALKPGAAAPVTFKNVFNAAADFTFACEPADFTVAKPKENVPAKKATTVPVTYKPVDAAKPALNGKLTVSGPDGFTQSYYLKGEP